MRGAITIPTYIASCDPWKTLVVYMVLCLIPAMYMSSLKKKYRGTANLNRKYYAFHRYDVEYWNVWRLAINSFIFLHPVRYAVTWYCISGHCIFIWINTIGQP